MLKNIMSIVFKMVLILGITACGGGNNDDAHENIEQNNSIESYSAHATTSISKLKKTGQTTSYEEFDDAHYQIGMDINYTKKGDIVIDNATGLMWQNDEEVGDIIKDWDNANTYCSTYSIEGYNDWRLPSLEELITIVNVGKFEPALDSIFTASDYSNNYWTATSFPTDTSLAWSVSFLYIIGSGSIKKYKRNIRCVRGKLNNSNDLNRFDKDINGVISDRKTGLAWQDNYSDNGGKIKISNWSDALQYCNDLTLDSSSDWRLPNINELVSILDTSRDNPAINSIFSTIPSHSSYGYWSSSTEVSRTPWAWFIFFDEGRISWALKEHEFEIRCVRGGTRESNETEVL